MYAFTFFILKKPLTFQKPSCSRQKKNNNKINTGTAEMTEIHIFRHIYLQDSGFIRSIRLFP